MRSKCRYCGRTRAYGNSIRIDGGLPVTYSRCARCDEYQPLGLSNDDAPGVAVEIRAAAIDRQPEGSAETIGWIAYVTDSPCGDFDDATSAGYLAAAIEHHDEEQGQ